jgi:hypothetical protein
VSEFSLSRLVREVCRDSDIIAPDLLAKEVNRRIRKADRDAALQEALESYVGQYVARHRSGFSVSPGGQPCADAHSGSAAGGHSHKVAAIRDIARSLRDRVSVGAGPGEWKFLADCTAENLAYAAAMREEHARRTYARAQQYRRLAELLDEHGVSTVGELPRSVLGDELGEAA